MSFCKPTFLNGILKTTKIAPKKYCMACCAELSLVMCWELMLLTYSSFVVGVPYLLRWKNLRMWILIISVVYFMFNICTVLSTSYILSHFNPWSVLDSSKYYSICKWENWESEYYLYLLQITQWRAEGDSEPRSVWLGMM